MSLIAKVGCMRRGLDAAGEQARQTLGAVEINDLWARDCDHATGRTLILYMLNGRRFMISDPGANTTFTRQDISTSMHGAVATARLMHVSGYALITPERRMATLQLMRQAKTAGATVAVDLSPHNLHQLVDAPGLLEDLRGTVDWLLGEATTARGILGSAAIEDTHCDVGDLASALARWAPSVAVFENPGAAVVQDRGQRDSWRYDYEPGPASRGQSARAQAALLAAHMT